MFVQLSLLTVAAMVQFTHTLNGPHVSHVWSNKCVGILDTTCVYTHMQYLHMHVMFVWLL